MTQRKQWYEVIDKYHEKERILIIQGLRRIGKSIILKSLFKNDNQATIKFYYEFNIFGNDDHKYCLELFNSLRDFKKEKVLLCLDEFQEFPEWNKLFKSIYDLYPNVKIIATGSINHNTTATNNTEGGRYFVLPLPVLSLKEYVDIFQKSQLIMDDTLFDYISTGAYPDVSWSEDGITEYRKKVNDNVIEKAKDGNRLERYKIQKASQVDAILKHLITNLGGFMTPNSISNKLAIGTEACYKIVAYLKDCHIINELNVYHRQMGKATMWNSKYYLEDFTMYSHVKQKKFKFLFESTNTEEKEYASFVVENVVYNHLKSLDILGYNNLYYLKTKTVDIDFVYLIEGDPKYIEVKSSSNVDCLSISQKKFAIENKLNVIYFGDSKLHNGINYINIIEFLKSDKSIKLY